MLTQEPMTATEIAERWRVVSEKGAKDAMFICEEFQKALTSAIERIRKDHPWMDEEKKNADT